MRFGQLILALLLVWVRDLTVPFNFILKHASFFLGIWGNVVIIIDSIIELGAWWVPIDYFAWSLISFVLAVHALLLPAEKRFLMKVVLLCYAARSIHLKSLNLPHSPLLWLILRFLLLSLLLWRTLILILRIVFEGSPSLLGALIYWLKYSFNAFFPSMNLLKLHIFNWLLLMPLNLLLLLLLWLLLLFLRLL